MLRDWVSSAWHRLETECFSIAFMNLLKCVMYSGKVSRLQCPPSFTHSGSYFSLESSHNRFPWEKSTTSSAVPCMQHAPIQIIIHKPRPAMHQHAWIIILNDTASYKQARIFLTWITKTGQLTWRIFSIFCKLNNNLMNNLTPTTEERNLEINNCIYLENIEPQCCLHWE